MQIIDNELDVTLLEPKQKHPAIFAKFDALAEGKTLVILNDHDPRPLYYQLLAERGNVFTWQYLEQGPEWWKVIIGKRKKEETDETLGEIAAKDVAKVRVFKKYGLDFCCGGKKTLKEACREKGLDVVKVEQELQDTMKPALVHSIPYNEWSPAFLCDYIVNTHHQYVRKVVPEIQQYAAKVAAVHGKQHPELVQIRDFVEKLAVEMNTHMMKEEKVVFPYIKSLFDSLATDINEKKAQLGPVSQSVSLMESEHETVGAWVSEINILSKSYSLPENACASYTVLYQLLREFEEDLHLHIHLENNILFVKAMDHEKKHNG